MIRSSDLQDRQVASVTLTDRQQEVFRLVTDYYAVAHELPSTGWISRRLHISRQRAQVLLETLRSKHFLR